MSELPQKGAQEPESHLQQTSEAKRDEEKILIELMNIQAHWLEMKPYLISLFYSAEKLPTEISSCLLNIQNDAIEFLHCIREICDYLEFSPKHFEADSELIQKGPEIFENLESHLSLDERFLVGLFRVKRSLSFIVLCLLRMRIKSQSHPAFDSIVKITNSKLYHLQSSFGTLFEKIYNKE